MAPKSSIPRIVEVAEFIQKKTKKPKDSEKSTDNKSDKNKGPKNFDQEFYD
jgi:hypothetical protein